MPDAYLASLHAGNCRATFCEQFDEKSRIWNYNRHEHSLIELIYFLEGKADIKDKDRTMALSLFELVVYPAHVAHQEYLDTRYHQAVICLHLSCEAALPFDRLFKLKDEQGILRWLMRQIHHEFHHEGPYQQQLLNDLINLLISQMQKISHEYQAPKANIAEKCMQFIQEHFSEPIDMGRLSQEMFVSPSYLNRMFKRRFGTTPILYLNRYRMEVAREMLVQTDSKISAISSFVGLEDSKHFAKLFKRMTSLSPAAYRVTFTNKPETS